MKPALDQVLFRSTRTTLPLWPVRCKNSYSLQRGMKFIVLHPRQDQNETGFTPFTQGLGAVGRPSHRRGAFIQSEDLEGGAVWPRNVWQKCCLWPDIFLPVGILVMQVLCSTGQKAGCSVKNSSLSPFLNFFPLKSGSNYAVLAGFFYSIGGICTAAFPKRCLSIWNYIEVQSKKCLSAFHVERKLINSSGLFQHVYGPRVQHICHWEENEFLHLHLCEREGFVLMDFVSVFS